MGHRDRVETEARAKIFWGDSTESVIAYLQSQGINQQEAQTIMDSVLAEREEFVRAEGKKRIIVGALLILVPIIAYVVFATIGVFPLKLFGLTVVVGLYGGWKIVKGTINVLSPGSDRSDLSDHSGA